MNRLKAALAALAISGLILAGMLIIGLEATTEAAAAATVAPAAIDGTAAGQITQLQALIRQYQQREEQYQAQLGEATMQVQQLQQVLIALQERGVIQITSNGEIRLRERDHDRDND